MMDQMAQSQSYIATCTLRLRAYLEFTRDLNPWRGYRLWYREWLLGERREQDAKRGSIKHGKR